MKWKEMQVMDRQKNRIPVVNKTNITKIKKIDQERITDWLKIKKKANFKEIVNWNRVNMSQPLYLLNDLADYLWIEVTIFMDRFRFNKFRHFMLYRTLVNGRQKLVINTVHFKLVSNFSRFSSNHGGSCIFV
jgi:hypothetical protein